MYLNLTLRTTPLKRFPVYEPQASIKSSLSPEAMKEYLFWKCKMLQRSHIEFFYYLIHSSYLTQISWKKNNVISSGLKKSEWKRSLAVYMQTPISMARCSFCNAIRFKQRKMKHPTHSPFRVLCFYITKQNNFCAVVSPRF